MSHQFALYYEDVASFKKGQQLVLKDSNLVRRVVSVLRLQAQDQLVIFNEEFHALVKLVDCSRKHIECIISSIELNKSYSPSITLLLPLLKREAFEESLYSAVECGVNVIQVVTTQKTRNWGGNKEYERARRIMISAAEQSKNYLIPELREPVVLQDAIQGCSDGIKIFADPSGEKFNTIPQDSHSYTVLVGPEGDLTDQEKLLVREYDFLFCSLTPTVLRARQAVSVLVGMMRSLI